MSTPNYMPSIGYSPNRFTLHNAAPERKNFRWAGLAFTLPAVDEVGPRPALDADGEPIPGTLVLQDAITTDKDGTLPAPGSPPNWLAFEAIRNVLGVDPTTKVASGMLAKSGVSFLPPDPTKDLIARVREDGKRRYMESMVDWAQYTIAAYEARIVAARSAGVTPPPPDRDFGRAHAIISVARAEEKQAPVEVPPDEDEIMAEARMKALAMEMASKAAEESNVDKAALAEKLLLDPKVRAFLSRKYQFRKRGHVDMGEVPIPEEPPKEE